MDNEGVPGRAPRPDQLLEEASLWFARMRGPDAEQFRPGFERWLSLGSEQLGAYNRAGEIFALGKFLAETPNEETIAERNHIEPRINVRVTVIAMSLLILVGVGAWFGRSLILPTSQTVPVVSGAPRHSGDLLRYSTDRGERRELALADGSKVTLEAGSVLTAEFGPTRRALTLEHGRARFEVAHEGRPFVVFAGGGSVTARGTIFDVIVDAEEGVTVHLLRGAVDVESAPKVPSDAHGKLVTRLEPGETLNFAVSRSSLAQNIPDGPTLAATLPRLGGEAIEFEKASLAQIVERANQGAAVSIRLSDPTIGDLKVSGRFRIDDPEQLSERLAALLDLKVDHISDQEILLRPR